MDIPQRVLDLLERYTANACTDPELTELFGYLHSGKYDALLEQHISDKLASSYVPGADLEAYRGEAMVRKIVSTPEANKAIIRRIGLRQRLKKTAIAASVIAVAACLGLLIYFYQPASPSKPVVSSLLTNSKQYVNNTDKAVQLPLEDGSRITLQPSAAITYPVRFAGDRREVLLEGDAFFDIARNPDKPFLVYHGNLVTRVLGTSFYIRYDKNQHEAEVEVTHGKVEVYENTDIKKSITKSNGVIITPNQKVTYTESKQLFSTSLVDNPIPIHHSDSADSLKAVANQYNLDNASLSSITRLLQDNYGIEIEMENEKLTHCLFTGDLSNYSLYDKLDIICKAIGGSYEIKGTKILIKGQGC